MATIQPLAEFLLLGEARGRSGVVGGPLAPVEGV